MKTTIFWAITSVSLSLFITIACSESPFLAVAANSGPSSLILVDPITSIGKNITPTIRVSGVASGNTVKLYVNNACTAQVAIGVATGPTIDLTSTGLSDGTYNYHAIKNSGSGDSDCSSAFVTYTIDTVLSTISIIPNNIESTEGTSAKTFTMNISPVKTYDVTVGYNFYGSTAEIDTHYSGLFPGTVVIPAGQSSVTTPYSLLENTVADGEKYVQLILNQINLDTSILGMNQARNYIADNDSAANNTAIKVTSGANYTCAITTSGVLKCWGINSNGQLGDGTTTDRTSPVIIDAGTNYSLISANNGHTCGITTAGVLKCWGLNSDAQLGDGTTTQRTTPVIIDTGNNYSMISVGFYHTCGITTVGVLKCWGINSSLWVFNQNSCL